MADLECTECGNEIESADDLVQESAEEIETDDDGSVSVYGDKQNLFLCEDCRKLMGVGRSTD